MLQGEGRLDILFSLVGYSYPMMSFLDIVMQILSVMCSAEAKSAVTYVSGLGYLNVHKLYAHMNVHRLWDNQESSGVRVF